MSQYLCRLCAKACSGHKNLYDTKGSPNEDYEITFKYFPAKFLELSPSTNSAVLCLKCWEHIVTFYNFQLSVIETQKRLIEAEQKLGQKYEAEIDRFAIPSTDGDNKNVKFVRLMGMKICGAVTQEDINNETAAVVPTERDRAVKDEPTDSQFKGEAVSAEADTKITATTEIHSTIETTVPTVSKVTAKKTGAISCKKCDNSFDNRMKYSQHKKAAHRTLQYKCELCEQIFEMLSDFQSHAKFYADSKYFTCPLCWQKFLNLDHVKLHVDQMHKEDNKEEVMCRVITTLGCCVPQPTTDSEVEKSCRKKKKPKMLVTYTCKRCGSSFTEVAIYREHKKLAHSTLQYMCQLCKKLFENLIDFQKHIKAYADTEYYTCPHCWKKFLHLTDVKSHVEQTHLEQKPEYAMQKVITTKGCCVLPSKETADSPVEITSLESDGATISTINETIGEYESDVKNTKSEI